MSELIRARSVLAVQDLERSTRYFTEVLGFSVDPIRAPGWSFLSRGPVLLMLGECPDEVPARETGNHAWFLHILVEDVDELHGDFQERGARIVVPVGNRAHGHREFVVESPDGHRILFAQRLT